MGTYAGEILELFPSLDTERETSKPLGERLRGRASDLDLDSVDAVRELRERQ